MIAIKTLIFIHVNQVTGLLQIKTDFSRTFALKKKKPSEKRLQLGNKFLLVYKLPSPKIEKNREIKLNIISPATS